MSDSREAFREILNEAHVFTTPDGTPCASVELDGRLSHFPILESGFAGIVRARYLDLTEEAPNRADLRRELETLAAVATHRGPVIPLHVRIAPSPGGGIYIDRASEDRRFVHVTREGWELLDTCDVRFWRTPGTGPLPVPEAGNLDDLEPFLPVVSETHRRLLVGYLVAALNPVPPHFILVLQGEHGSGKTTLARMLSALIHPAALDVRHRAKSDEDLLISARREPLLIEDNLSRINNSRSDTLCGLATGTGFAKRRLYTGLEEDRFSVSCRLILTGLRDLIEKDDLRSRAIILDLPDLPDARRIEEGELHARFNEARPKLLGGLYDAVAGALRNPDPYIAHLPRMSTPAKWVTAAEPALGWDGGSFVDALAENRVEAVEAALDLDPVAPAVWRLMQTHDTWIGTATELLVELKRHRDPVNTDPDWPRGPGKLGIRLNHIASALREVGIKLDRQKEAGGNRTRLTVLSTDDFATLAQAKRRRKARLAKRANASRRSSRPRQAGPDRGSRDDDRPGWKSMITRFFRDPDQAA